MNSHSSAVPPRPVRRRLTAIALTSVLALMSTACASNEDAGAGASEASGDGALSVVATTSILGDVTQRVVGDAADVTTLMPPGSDPHSFGPSAQQVAQMQEADLVVANGAGLEQQLEDALAEAEDAGVPVFHATDHVETLAFAGHGEGEHSDEGQHGEGEEHAEGEHSDEEEHSGEEHSDEGGNSEGEHSEGEHSEEEHSDGEHSGEEHAHEHGADDPHFWMDPTRMSAVAEALAGEVGQMAGDAAPLDDRAAEYAQELEDVDTETDDMLSSIPAEQRKLVTNHEAFGYFADRYDFEVVGTVIPDTSTGAEPSAQDLQELARTIEQEQVDAIFTENTTSDQLAETLAAEVGSDVSTVQLFSDSLGEEGSDAATYVDLLRTNAERISDALGGE